MTKTGSYKGNPTISLAAESKWPFTFGVAKARLILENIEAIRAFVAQNGQGERDNVTRDEAKQ